MKITITFDTDNASFQDGFFDSQIELILKQAESAICKTSDLSRPLRDENGNTVGTVTRKFLKRKR